MRWASVDSAYSSSADRLSVPDRRTSIMTGWSPGLTLLNDGGDGICGGSWRWARAIIDCTSCAAASMFRLRSNCSTTFELPSELVELIELSPAIDENCFSSGRATADAIVSGLAPGRPALTWIVGKSMLGRSLTGSCRYAIAPDTNTPSMVSVV